MLQTTTVDFQGFPASIGRSTRHGRNMEVRPWNSTNSFRKLCGRSFPVLPKLKRPDFGKNVNAGFPGVLGSNLSALPDFGVFARVDFDVAVTAETTTGGKGSMWGLGAEGGKDSRSQTVSRVVFAVPLRLPDGDQTKRLAADEAETARKNHLRQLGKKLGGGSDPLSGMR